jgi:hypothetical protein
LWRAGIGEYRCLVYIRENECAGKIDARWLMFNEIMLRTTRSYCTRENAAGGSYSIRIKSCHVVQIPRIRQEKSVCLLPLGWLLV